MPIERFSDRLDAQRFADDPVVGVFESDPSEQDAIWLAERLFSRLVLVAQGYELHTLPLLGGSDPVRINRAQCQNLLDELEFVALRLNDDPLAVNAAQSIANYVSSRVRRPGEEIWVTFEGE